LMEKEWFECDDSGGKRWERTRAMM
jgi:hypothetical protein